VVSYAVDLLRREPEQSAFQEELLEKVEEELTRLKVLTGGLLSFSSSRESNSRVVSLNELIEEVLKLLRFELQRKSIELVTDCGDIPVISADPNKLKQVVINLIMNAVQAMNGEGRVELVTRICAAEVELLVCDNGPGTPAEMREQVFAPFFTPKPEGGGMGLGLYICRNIVREHGGTIVVESRDGEGSCFRIRLPAT
jgi:signal transduction histidine kinase